MVLDIQILAFNDGVNGLEYPQTVAHGVYADLSEITLVEVYQHVAGNIVIWETTVSWKRLFRQIQLLRSSYRADERQGVLPWKYTAYLPKPSVVTQRATLSTSHSRTLLAVDENGFSS